MNELLGVDVLAAEKREMTTLQEFKDALARDGWPNGVHWDCPDCGEKAPEELTPAEDGLHVWNAYYSDSGGSGWVCICCPKCQHHYAVDIST